MQRVTTLRDVEQGAGQRRGHARTDQQAGQGAQHTRTDQAAAALIARDVFQAITHRHRQLQLEEAEHRQRQQHENCGETAQQPRVLQPGLQVRPQGSRQHAHRRIHQRHAHHVTAGQRQTAFGRSAAADNQSGQNRQHRQRARCEGQQQAKTEEHQQAPAQRTLLQVAGQGLVGRFIRRTGRNGAAQIYDFGLRWITQTGVGTALITHVDLTAGAGGNLQFQALTINLLLTEKLVAVGFALRQCRMLIGRQTIEFQAFLIQVIAVGNLPKELGFTGFQAFRGENERFVDGQKIGFGLERIASGLGQAGEQQGDE
ncbi:hypothetical protein D3C87_1253330 [compost metagenome]